MRGKEERETHFATKRKRCAGWIEKGFGGMRFNWPVLCDCNGVGGSSIELPPTQLGILQFLLLFAFEAQRDISDL